MFRVPIISTLYYYFSSHNVFFFRVAFNYQAKKKHICIFLIKKGSYLNWTIQPRQVYSHICTDDRPPRGALILMVQYRPHPSCDIELRIIYSSNKESFITCVVYGRAPANDLLCILVASKSIVTPRKLNKQGIVH